MVPNIDVYERSQQNSLDTLTYENMAPSDHSMRFIAVADR